MDKIHVARASYGAIGDELAGRMPLAYAHIVQVLVDGVLWMYPLMAISNKMSPLLAVLGTGVLTISYQGLFDLAKQFLDPYDNESFGRGEDPLVVDTLIAETNAGSVRWLSGIQEYPLSTQRIKDGDLSDFLLPVRGISVPELEQLEQERLERERELQLRREKEEAKRRKEEKRQRELQKAAEAMIPAIYNPEEDGAFYSRLEELPTTYSMASNAILSDGETDILSKTLSNEETSNQQAESATALDPFTNIVVQESEVEMSLGIADVVNRLDEFAGGVPVALVPKGTAVAHYEPKKKKSTKKESKNENGEAAPKDGILEILPEEKMLEIMERVDESDALQQQNMTGVDTPTHPTNVNGVKANGERSETFNNNTLTDVPDSDSPDDERRMNQVIPSLGIMSPYNDVPWSEEVDAEGREIFMSTILAEEARKVDRDVARKQTRQKESIISDRQEQELIDTETRLANLEDESPQERSDEETNSGVRWFGRDVDVVEEEEDDPALSSLDGLDNLWGGSEGDYAESPDYMAEAIGRPTSPSGATQRMTRPREPIAPRPKQVAKAFPLSWQPGSPIPSEPSSPPRKSAASISSESDPTPTQNDKTS